MRHGAWLFPLVVVLGSCTMRTPELMDVHAPYQLHGTRFADLNIAAGRAPSFVEALSMLGGGDAVLAAANRGDCSAAEREVTFYRFGASALLAGSSVGEALTNDSFFARLFNRVADVGTAALGSVAVYQIADRIGNDEANLDIAKASAAVAGLLQTIDRAGVRAVAEDGRFVVEAGKRLKLVGATVEQHIDDLRQLDASHCSTPGFQDRFHTLQLGIIRSLDEQIAILEMLPSRYERQHNRARKLREELQTVRLRLGHPVS